MGRPPIIATSDELAQKVDDYFFSGCAATRTNSNGEEITRDIPTLSGLATFLGYTREGFYRLCDRGDDFLHIVKWAQEKITTFHEQNIGSGETCTGSIFWLKCNGKYVEKKEDVTEEKKSKFQISVGMAK